MGFQVDSPRRWALLRIAGALIIGLFLLLRAAQALGIVSVPNPRSVYGWRDTLCLTAVLSPLLFVFIGMACSRVAEIIGWSLLLVLLFVAVIG